MKSEDKAKLNRREGMIRRKLGIPKDAKVNAGDMSRKAQELKRKVAIMGLI